MTNSAPPTQIIGTDALLMVGDPNSLLSRDSWLKAGLEDNGWTVTVVDDDTITLTQADGADLVVISESTKSAKSAVVADTTAGIVSAESWGWDDLDMATTVGVDDPEDAIDITDATHPLADGLAVGTHTTSTAGLYHGWGTTGGDVAVAATIEGDANKATLFSYDTADTLADSSTAAGRRVGWFHYGGTATYLNTTAEDLFAAAVTWAGTVPANQETVGTDVLLMVGDPVSLTNRDTWMKDRLEGAGWTVTAVDDDTITVAQADGADLVVIAESTQSAKSAVILDTTAGVVSAEAWGWDNLNLATTVGTVQSEDSIDVIDPHHRISETIPAGELVTSSIGLTHGWGTVTDDAKVIATIGGDLTKPSVFSYDTGDALTTGTAAGRRVGWFHYGSNPGSPPTETWSYPNLQGTITVQADGTGAKTVGTLVYDPDGIPVAGGLPDTRPGDLDDTWLGAHARPLEHAQGLQPIIEMGARQYDPVLARFLEVDPIEGGILNDYGYVTDPINQLDLDGKCGIGNPFQQCWMTWDVRAEYVGPWRDETYIGGLTLGVQTQHQSKSRRLVERQLFCTSWDCHTRENTVYIDGQPHVRYREVIYRTECYRVKGGAGPLNATSGTVCQTFVSVTADTGLIPK